MRNGAGGSRLVDEHLISSEARDLVRQFSDAEFQEALRGSLVALGMRWYPAVRLSARPPVRHG
jgi:hypothetical protein